MHRLIRPLLAASLTLLTGLACARDAPTTIPPSAVQTAVQLRDKAMHDDTAYQLVAGLTTEVGARLAGGVNDRRARDWLVAKFKALGFDKVYIEPVTYPLWVRRSEHGAIVAPFPQPLTLTALGYSPGTPKGGLTAQVVQFADLDALRAADPASVKGKIVYIGERMPRRKDGLNYVRIGSPIRVHGPVIAQQKGAAGFLLRSAGTDAHNRTPHTGVTGFKDPAKAIPAAALSNPDADQLERVLASGQPVTLKLDLDCGIEGQYTGANVIGDLTGSKHPEQVVAIGGHLDSWDLGTGAIDDGAGVAIAAGAAKLIHDLPQRPDRTLRVIAFANEEMGWGGPAYAARHAAEVDRFQLGSESDFGAGPVWRMSASVKPGARGAIEQIARVLAPIGVRYDANHPGDGGSDLSQLHGKGMAALNLDQDGTDYFDWHHNANDTLDKIDPKQLAQNVAVYAVFSYMAAQASGDFGSTPGAFAHDGTED